MFTFDGGFKPLGLIAPLAEIEKIISIIVHPKL